MSKKKKILLIVFVVFLIIFGAFFFFRSRIGEITPGPGLPRPSIPAAFKGKFEIEFSLPEETSLPKELPILEVSPSEKFSETRAREIAANFGHTFEPRVAEDIYDGTTYIWEVEDSVLYVRARTRRVEYQSYVNPLSAINKQLSNEALIQTAEDFLLSNRLVSAGEVEFSSFIFYKIEASKEGLFPTNKNEATLYQLNFSHKFSGYEILTIDPQKTPVVVTLLPDGSVYRAVVASLGETKESQSTYKTKSLNEVKVQAGNATLVSLDDGNVYLEDLRENDIEKMIVKEVVVAYFREGPDAKIYQPIYLLKGEASVRGFAEGVSAVLYLPAISN